MSNITQLAEPPMLVETHRCDCDTCSAITSAWLARIKSNHADALGGHCFRVKHDSCKTCGADQHLRLEVTCTAKNVPAYVLRLDVFTPDSGVTRH